EPALISVNRSTKPLSGAGAGGSVAAVVGRFSRRGLALMNLVGKAIALGLIAVATLLAPGGSGPAAADELDDLFVRILVNPGDVGLNLQYARMAEDRGILR